MKRLLLLLAACGGHAAHVDAPAAPSGAARELVLYRDGAMVRDTREADLKAGANTIAMAIPDDVDAGGLLASVVTPASGVEIGSIRLVTPSLQPGDHVRVVDGKRTIEGTLGMMGDGVLALQSGEILFDPRHVVRIGGGDASRHIELSVEAEAATHATIELSYLTQRLSWTADYTLVMDAAAHEADLRGALGIDNGTGVAYDHAAVTLVDTNRPVKVTAFDQTIDDDADTGSPGKPAPVADPFKPRGDQPVKLKKPTETPHTTLPFTVDVVPGSQSVSLLAGAEALPASQTMVYDPVGEGRNQSGREADTDPNFGLDKQSSAVAQSIDVAVSKVPAGLPAGKVRLLERLENGALTPLGESRIFERAGSDTEAVAPTTSVAIGRAAEIEGKRTRRDFTYDADGKKLYEEFEIDLTSTADHPIDVIVREHMYRGLNWSLAYWNTATISKEGPQKVAMTATVPAKGKAKIVYEVVYHW